jgi:Tfp pilus assembly protein PilF
VSAGTYNRAAAFFLERGLKPTQALQWAQKSVQMDRKYYTTWTLAEAYAANGDLTNAMKEGQIAIDLATKDGDDGAAKGYQVKMESWGKK